MQSHLVVQLNDLIFFDTDGRPHLVVQLVRVGNNRIQSVVSAAKLTDDQHGIFRDLAALRDLQNICLGDGGQPPGGNKPDRD